MLFSFKKNNSNQLIDISLALFLASLPLPLAFNNVALIFFCLVALFNFKKKNFQINYVLLVPVCYYILCAVSLVWTIDLKESFKYLSKGVYFILLPFIFFTLPKIDICRRNKIFNLHSYLMIIATIFYLSRAFWRYINDGDYEHFFYHNLVTTEVNAIYVSLFIAFAFINLLNKSKKNIWEILGLILLFIFLILLSSKNVIIITLIGVINVLIYNLKHIWKRLVLCGSILGLLLMIPVSTKIYERFQLEFVSTSENTILENGVINVSLKNALEQEEFSPNYFFNGSAFRLYQARIFKEIMHDEHKYLTGYGISAIQNKITQKHQEDQLHESYYLLNFHNQYLQTFSTLGIFGLGLLLIMIICNWLKAIKYKDVPLIFFSLLTSSIMLTESLFDRQRGILFFVLIICIFHHIKSTSINSTNNTN